MDATLVLRCLSEPESEADLRSVKISEIAQKLTEIATFFQWAISNEPKFFYSFTDPGISRKKDWQFSKLYRSQEGSQSVDKKNWLYDWQCYFELMKLTKFFNQKNPRSPSMVMTLPFLVEKMVDMTVGNPIPWGRRKRCSIFFLLNERKYLIFLVFGA